MSIIAIRLSEFIGHECHRCGQPMEDHWIRPLHVAELPDARAAEIGCPMLVLDLGAASPAKPVAYEGR